MKVKEEKQPCFSMQNGKKPYPRKNATADTYTRIINVLEVQKNKQISLKKSTGIEAEDYTSIE